MPPKPKGHIPQVSADFLREVDSITVVLPSGKKATFHPADELMIPTDPEERMEAYTKAPAQLAFWEYQAERAMHDCRRLERIAEKLDGESSLVYRKWKEQEGEKITEDLIRSHVHTDDKVCQAKNDLIAARATYGLLRATRDAIQHRVFVLRQLVSTDAYAKPRG